MTLFSEPASARPPLFSGSLPPGSVQGNALFVSDSDGRLHRLWLTRWWGARHPCAAFVGINPSDASGIKDDNTIRRCVSFAQREGWSSFAMLNLFSIVSDDPKILDRSGERHGPGHAREREDWLRRASVVVVCWGGPGHQWGGAVKHALSVIPSRTPILCFGLTKTGQPRHPLYLRGDTPLVPYTQEKA